MPGVSHGNRMEIGFFDVAFSRLLQPPVWNISLSPLPAEMVVLILLPSAAIFNNLDVTYWLLAKCDMYCENMYVANIRRTFRVRYEISITVFAVTCASRRLFVMRRLTLNNDDAKQQFF